MDENNPKNHLAELVQSWGHRLSVISYQTEIDYTGAFHCEVRVKLSDYFSVTGDGYADQKKAAEMAAAKNVLSNIRENHAHFLVNWDDIYVQAQAGDSLVKLAAYTSASLPDRESKSRWLQRYESNEFFGEIYDKLWKQGDPRIQPFGNFMNIHRKATIIESLIWLEYGSKFLTEETSGLLEHLFSFQLFPGTEEDTSQGATD